MENNDTGATGPDGARYTEDLVKRLQGLASGQSTQVDSETISQACTTITELYAALKTTRATIRIMDDGKRYRDERIASLEAMVNSASTQQNEAADADR